MKRTMDALPIRIAAVILLVFSFAGCASRPASFVQTFEPKWISIEIRQGADFESAWKSVVDVLARKFELEVISKDGGYVRTNWNYGWLEAGKVSDKYRVRVTAKFSPDRMNVDLKTEANFHFKKEGWIEGFDTRLLETIKQDIGGVIGRTTR